MQLSFLLAKTDLELSKEEVLAVVRHDSSWLHGNLLMMTPKDTENLVALQKRLAVTHSIPEFLFSCPQAELVGKIKGFSWQSTYQEDFSLRVHQLTIRQKHQHNTQDANKDDYNNTNRTNTPQNSGFSEKNLSSIVWHALKDPIVKLRDAKTQIHAFLYGDYAVVAKQLTSDYQEFEKRRPHLRNFAHSGSMHPRLCRALVNLVGAKEREKILDPCCGSGGLLIEAALMGLEAEGYDINRTMVWGTIRNMAQQKLSNYTVTCKDALSLQGKWDYVVTDLPYGLNSVAMSREKRVSMKREVISGKRELEEFYLAFFKKIKEILEKRAVVVMPHYVEYRQMFAETGLRIEKEFNQYVHKNLTRKIVVLEPR